MLSELHIKKFSIIEDIQIKFHEGFQAISGETGAGKSFLVQALQFVLGARADNEILRPWL
jgi:DNA repair protein RecN (Recombination protein N)